MTQVVRVVVSALACVGVASQRVSVGSVRRGYSCESAAWLRVLLGGLGHIQSVDRIVHVAGELAAPGQDEGRELRVIAQVGHLQGLAHPVLRCTEVPRVLVEPAGEFRVPRVQLQEPPTVLAPHLLP
ncbi:hypothetical protein [Streptomyces sp. ODS28]|uniref:hypothetical protein n=1 Tax=Streptomyces sp. ODS28 TaxID=3136688 RepID=UPI0031E739D0